ncbi:hypothetical protein RHECNPAF_2530067 [Rhizobium etli CNPAF512]|nr:hypothetical protein RHECNPAF_2530067 [Rhizobium etli CNPAF512]
MPIAARSPEPAKRCARPQSLSASATGRLRASISASTEIAPSRRPPRRIHISPVAMTCERSAHRPGGLLTSFNRVVTAIGGKSKRRSGRSRLCGAVRLS